jgi:hypothetical protein
MEIRKPVRLSHEGVQDHAAPAAAVFALLCPVRETEWVPGWDPGIVHTEGGLVEEDCVFTTEDAAGEAVWYVHHHDPAARTAGMVKIVPGHLATRLDLSVEETASTASRLRVRYTWTALSESGAKEVADWTADRWDAFMEQWREVMAAHLRGGS